MLVNSYCILELLWYYHYIFRERELCVIWSTVQNIQCRHADNLWHCLKCCVWSVVFNIIQTCSLFAIASEESVSIACRKIFDLSHLKLKFLTVTALFFLGGCMSWLSVLSLTLELRCQSSYGVPKGKRWQAACPSNFCEGKRLQNLCLIFMNAVLSQVCISVIALWVKKWKNKTHMNDISSIYS